MRSLRSRAVAVTQSDGSGRADLRPARQAKNITLTAAAHHFGVWPAVISCIERGTRRDDNLANAYRNWLTAA